MSTLFQKKIEKDDSLKNYLNEITYYDNIDETIKNTDIVLIMTEWPIIKNFDLQKYELLMKTPYIFDGRNCYDINQVKKYQIYYNSIGREVIDNLKNKSL